MLTAAVESDLGRYTKQINGPAVGIFQMEPESYRDLLRYVRKKQPDYLKYLSLYAVQSDLKHQILLARLFYLRDGRRIPPVTQPLEIAKYYKRVWNTHLGKSTAFLAFRKYLIFCH